MLLYDSLVPLCAHQETRLYWRTFDAIHELAPQTREGAKRASRATPSGGDLRAAARGAFHPGASPGVRSSVRLAIGSGGSWLFVDSSGFAERDGETGRFDVLAWQRWLRREASPAALPPGRSIRLAVENRSARPIRLIDATGFVRAEVEADSRKAVGAWFATHRVEAGGREIGKVGFLEAIYERRPPAGGRCVLVLIGRDRYGSWKPLKGVYRARLVVKR